MIPNDLYRKIPTLQYILKKINLHHPLQANSMLDKPDLIVQLEHRYRPMRKAKKALYLYLLGFEAGPVTHIITQHSELRKKMLKKLKFL